MIATRAMKRIVSLIIALVAVVLPAIAPPASAQGSRKDDIVFNSRGVPLAGASVHVCNMPATGLPCSPSAQLYSDPGLTEAIANPTTTDGMGNYFFYAAPGQYEIEISGPSITTKQIPNVILPSDPANPTFSSLSSTGGISAFTLSLSGNLTVNGSTSVVGNLASGTLTLSNQSTPPGAANAGTVNLYTKTLDKRLYYKDETGTEVGPLATASGAQTNATNYWTAPQYIDADFHTKGPNPAWDVTQFGGYIGPNYGADTTGTISSGSNALTVAAALDFAVGNGILVPKAGPAPIIATPQAPTVTPIAQAGSTSYSYCVSDQDWYGGYTPCGAAGSTATGPSSFGLKSYTISGWSSTNNLVTITTSTAHNIPTSKYQTFLWPQVEVESGTTNMGWCEGAFTVVAVPSSTTIQILRYGIADSITNACSGGTLRVLPRVILSWDSHYTYSVTNAACSGNAATLTVSPVMNGPNGTWVVPGLPKAVIAGVSDSHYNTTVAVGNNNSTITYPIVGGSCSGVNTGNLGGTVSVVPGKAVKSHLIYRCSGASCALPANAANYALVGEAVGNDGYFVDSGFGAGGYDLQGYASTAPTAASNDYLSTTITATNGTSFTLAASATNTASGVNVYHDNVPNLLAVCAAMPGTGGAYNGGHVIIPASLTPNGQGQSLFPINANLDTHTCPGNTTFDFRTGVWLQGTILVGNSINLIADQGSSCNSTFYKMGPLECVAGMANPMLYFEPEQSSNNFFQNLVFTPNQPYQSAFYYDEQLNDDGTTSQRYDNVHVNGAAGSMPIVDKAGFGRFWNFGGWSASNGNFATQRTYLFTQNCGMPPYVQWAGNAMGPSIIHTNHTYNLGTAEVNGCGNSQANFQNAVFNDMLSENMYGPIFLFNTSPYDASGVTFHMASYADPVGGASTPLYDFTNMPVAAGLRFDDIGCATATQPMMADQSSAGVAVSQAGASTCPFVGAPNYHFTNLASNLTVNSGFNQELLNSAQVYSPMAAPGNFQSVTQEGAGNVPVGTYQYCLTASDAMGGETTVGGCTSFSVTGQASVVQFVLPATFPAGATGLNLYINNALAQANGCVKPQYATPGGTYTYNYNYQCGGSLPTVTTAASAAINSTAVAAPKLLLNGEFTGSVARSEQNIFLPGALSTTWTASSWTPDKPVTVTRVQVQAKTAPAGCTTSAVVQLTNGTTPINLTISAAANDTGSISQNYAAGTALTVSLQTAAAGCSTTPADANVTVQYRMQ